MANEVYEKWLEYYDNNGLSWLAPQVQASIKQAFFSGYEAAEQSVHPTWGRLGNNWTGSRAPRG